METPVGEAFKCLDFHGGHLKLDDVRWESTTFKVVNHQGHEDLYNGGFSIRNLVLQSFIVIESRKMFASTNGGFRKSRYPIAGWFISRKTPSTKWMMTGGYPHDSGNLHEQLGDNGITPLFLNCF